MLKYVSIFIFSEFELKIFFEALSPLLFPCILSGPIYNSVIDLFGVLVGFIILKDM